MSPNINSFVGDLVEMARAMEELPGIKAKLDEAYALLEEERKTVQDRELRIQQLKADGDIMQERINTLEVARDDAELRFLEADEQRINTLDRLNQMGNIIRTVTAQLEPPKPQEPIVQAQPVEAKSEQEAFDGPSASEETSQSKPIDSTAEVAMSGSPANVDSWASGPGQSEADPITTAAPVDTQPSTASPMEASAGGTEEDYHWRPARPNAAF